MTTDDVPFLRRATWRGDQEIQRFCPLRLYEPTTLAHLRAIVADARAHRRRVRAVGAGHSYSDAARTPDFLVRMDGVTGVVPLDDACLAPGVEPGTRFLVRAGTTLLHMQERLATYGRTFENTGTFNLLTLAGAAMTATHGSGLERPAIADQIEAVVLVTADGGVRCVQPPGGPLVRSPVEGATLDTDAETFAALVPSVGAMGLVESVVVRTVPSYWLTERRTKSTWAEIEPQLAGPARPLLRGTPDDPRPFVEVYVSPYPYPRGADGTGPQNAILTHRSVTSQRHAEGAAARRPFVVDLFDRVDAVGNAAAWLFENSPEEWPERMSKSLGTLVDSEYTAVSYEVLSDSYAADGVGLELALRMDPEDRWLDAIRSLFAHLRRDADEGHVWSNVLSLRFVPPSTRLLSMHRWDDGSPTCMLELQILTRIHGVFDLYERLSRHMIEEHGARPHWGLEHGSLCARDVRKVYGDATIDRWRAVRDRLDPTRMFANRYTDRLGLT